MMLFRIRRGVSTYVLLFLKTEVLTPEAWLVPQKYAENADWREKTTGPYGRIADLSMDRFPV